MGVRKQVATTPVAAAKNAKNAAEGERERYMGNHMLIKGEFYNSLTAKRKDSDDLKQGYWNSIYSMVEKIM